MVKRKLNLKSKEKTLQSQLSDSRRIVIGLDLSLSESGIAVLSGEDYIIETKIIRTTTKFGDDRRVRDIAQAVANICKQYKDDHELYVYIEAIPFTRRPTGKTYTRTELFGLVKFLLFMDGIQLRTVTTTTLKKQFAKNGTADKTNIMAAVFNRYNRIEKNDNVADAIGLASIGNRHVKRIVNFPHIIYE